MNTQQREFCWQVSTEITAGGSTVWNLTARLTDASGTVLSTPPLHRPVLRSGEQWKPSWSTGWRVQDLSSPEQPVNPHALLLLPSPSAIEAADSAPSIEVLFQDDDDQWWRRWNHMIEPMTAEFHLNDAGGRKFNRAVALVDGANADPTLSCPMERGLVNSRTPSRWLRGRCPNETVSTSTISRISVS